jgi:hypothetical protein
MERSKMQLRDLFLDWRRLAGGALILAGAMFLVGESFGLGWAAYLAICLIGIVLIIWGSKLAKAVGVIVGSLLLGVGSGLLLGFGPGEIRSLIDRIGILICGLGLGFGAISLIQSLRTNALSWWPIFPFLIFLSTGSCMILSPANFLDYVLYVSCGLGAAFMWVGVLKRYVGFIVPGCILIGSGPGVYIAWGTQAAPNALAQTGLMLVCIAFGWIMITIISRLRADQLVWWPLIPGGILAMVGWGLYIGGNPGGAASFIGNTGSVGLIVIGLYLLLMRQSIRK